MNRRWIEKPVIPYATSLGALCVQVVALAAMIVVTGNYPGIHRHHGTLLAIFEATWYSIPLVAVVGIVSASMQIWRKERVITSALGLLLNGAYLAFGAAFAYASMEPRFLAV